MLISFSVYILRFSYTPAEMLRILLGIVGTLLIIQNEFTYTWRKKKIIKFGSLRRWLQMHIFAGLLGPVIILWHTNLNFYGFGGLVTYLMILVLASGLIGYFIYRFLPRSLKGKELKLKDLTDKQQQLENEMRKIMVDNPDAIEQILKFEALSPKSKGIGRMIYAILDYYDVRRQIHRLVASLGQSHSDIYKKLEKVAIKRLFLERQVIMLSGSERLLSNWTKIHRPITMTFFFTVGVHVITILYYGRSF